MKCPHCGCELTAEEIKALRAALNGSIKSEKKSASSKANGAKGGRPKGSKNKQKLGFEWAKKSVTTTNV